MTVAPVALLRRLVGGCSTVLLVLLLLFVALRVLPADPVAMSEPLSADTAQIEAARARLGADQLLPVQFAIWLGQMARGEFGLSVQSRRPVAEMLREALPATLELASLAVLATSVAGLLGGLALFALRRDAVRAAMESASTFAMSVPEVLWALGFILVFGVMLDLLPFIGRLDPAYPNPVLTGFLLVDTLLAGSPRAFLSALCHMVLPVLALAMAFAPPIARVLHAALAEAWQSEHIRQGRLRGLSEVRLLLGHAVPNALLPALAVMATQFVLLCGGVVLVEEVFSYPGMGNLLVDAVRFGDLPVMQAAGLGFCGLMLLTNAVLQGLHRVLDPLGAVP